MSLLIKGGTWVVTVWQGMSECREGQRGQPVSSALIVLTLDLLSCTCRFLHRALRVVSSPQTSCPAFCPLVCITRAICHRQGQPKQGTRNMSPWRPSWQGQGLGLVFSLNMVRSGAQDTQGKAGRAGLVQIGEGKVWRDLTALCSSLTGGCREDGARSSEVHEERKKGNWNKLEHGKFLLDTWKENSP